MKLSTPHTDSCRCVHSAAMYRLWRVFFPAVEFGGEPAGFQSLYFGAARCHSHTRNRPVWQTSWKISMS